MAVKIETLNQTTSKAEEIAHLRKFVSTLSEGTYLRSFLSDQLVEWIEQRIAADLPPDVYEQWSSSQKSLLRAEEELQRRGEELEKARDQLATLEAAVEMKDRLIVEMMSDQDKLAVKLNRVQRLVADAFLAGETIQPERVRDALLGR